MIDKVQKIRNKVEKLKAQLIRGACSSQIAMETRCKEEAYNEVLAILDSLQEEPVSDDLEEAANAYISNENNYSHSRTDTFKAGAKWKEQQMMRSTTEAT